MASARSCLHTKDHRQYSNWRVLLHTCASEFHLLAKVQWDASDVIWKDTCNCVLFKFIHIILKDTCNWNQFEVSYNIFIFLNWLLEFIYLIWHCFLLLSRLTALWLRVTKWTTLALTKSKGKSPFLDVRMCIDRPDITPLVDWVWNINLLTYPFLATKRKEGRRGKKPPKQQQPKTQQVLWCKLVLFGAFFYDDCSLSGMKGLSILGAVLGFNNIWITSFLTAVWHALIDLIALKFDLCTEDDLARLAVFIF